MINLPTPTYRCGFRPKENKGDFIGYIKPTVYDDECHCKSYIVIKNPYPNGLWVGDEIGLCRKHYNSVKRDFRL